MEEISKGQRITLLLCCYFELFLLQGNDRVEKAGRLAGGWTR